MTAGLLAEATCAPVIMTQQAAAFHSQAASSNGLKKQWMFPYKMNIDRSNIDYSRLL